MACDHIHCAHSEPTFRIRFLKWFGTDGLGDVDLAALRIVPGVNIKDPALFAPITGSAADHLCECARKFGTSLSILATGPLVSGRPPSAALPPDSCSCTHALMHSCTDAVMR